MNISRLHGSFKNPKFWRLFFFSLINENTITLMTERDKVCENSIFHSKLLCLAAPKFRGAFVYLKACLTLVTLSAVTIKSSKVSNVSQFEINKEISHSSLKQPAICSYRRPIPFAAKGKHSDTCTVARLRKNKFVQSQTRTTQ